MLNEQDIADYQSDDYFQPEGKEVKLYELSRGSYFAFKDRLDQIFKLKTIDGVYSLCFGITPDVAKDDKGEAAIYHFAAWVPVIKMQIKDKITDETED